MRCRLKLLLSRLMLLRCIRGGFLLTIIGALLGHCLLSTTIFPILLLVAILLLLLLITAIVVIFTTAVIIVVLVTVMVS